MPSHAPRNEPVRKVEELNKREAALILGIKNNISAAKLLSLTDKYRKAQLSMLKSRIHVFKENEYRRKSNTVNLQKLEMLTVEWLNKTSEAIIDEIKRSNGL